ncbi:protein transport protein SEC24-like [Galendromus occidentalis]|uniref:Protein transport protein SEC24-like n=1 Tax=Galendromus occidentalis TaxID=34638 RepID=A0AAJ7L585_9ACAR|nr:protein transport protein SEC24-like [Galendromus occidentalis]
MWSAIVSLCVCSASAQFNPFGFGHFPGQQGFDGYGSYGNADFSQFQGVSSNGGDFNANSLTGYGVPPSVNYGDPNQGFGQGFGQYGAVPGGYPGQGPLPQDGGQNHPQQGGPSAGQAVQHENSVQSGNPSFNPGNQGQAPVIGQPGQSVLNPGHQHNVGLSNQINANQNHAQSHLASQQLAPQLEHQHQVSNQHQFEVNYNGVSQYPEQYQGQQLGLQVPQQYQQQTQQNHREKSASSPSAASAPLESGSFRGIPLEAFVRQNYAQQPIQERPGSQQHPHGSSEAPSQGSHDQTEESTQKEVSKSS